MTYIKFWVSSKVGEIRPWTTVLAANECLKYGCCHFLAHLSRRLIGELLVYKGIRRPSVCRPSVRPSTFSNDISSETVRPILSILHI